MDIDLDFGSGIRVLQGFFGYHAFEDKLPFLVIIFSVVHINDDDLVFGRSGDFIMADFVHDKLIQDIGMGIRLRIALARRK